MKSKTLIALARIASGTAILVTSMVTGVDGAYQMMAMLLLGIPVEGLQSAKKTNSE
jgi:hypothetical protein